MLRRSHVSPGKEAPWSSGISTRSLAIAEKGSFTAAADVLSTVQSNVSEQVRQLERSSGRRCSSAGGAAVPTEFGAAVLERARRVQRELEAMRADLSMLQGLQAGHAPRCRRHREPLAMPALVADLRDARTGRAAAHQRGRVGAAVGEVIEGELAQAVVTEPVDDRRLVVEHLLDEALVGLVHSDTPLPAEPVPLSAVSSSRSSFRPPATRCGWRSRAPPPRRASRSRWP